MLKHKTSQLQLFFLNYKKSLLTVCLSNSHMNILQFDPISYYFKFLHYKILPGKDVIAKKKKPDPCWKHKEK